MTGSAVLPIKALVMNLPPARAHRRVAVTA
jgi:hypothetical protein